MKKTLLTIVILVVVLLLLIPIPMRASDGGTVRYQAVVYSVTNYHSLNASGGYDTGIEVKILGITVYKNTTFDQ